MRIISQDGTIDVPYEISSLSMAVGKYENVEHAAIFCHNSSTAMGTKMAGYSSKEKAKKAMELLRTAYTGRFITNAEVSQDFEKEIKELMKGGFGTVMVRDGDSRVEFNNLNGYFQFPTEEELE
ncbi:hypothetical protein [Roseburia inulinivorans]